MKAVFGLIVAWALLLAPPAPRAQLAMAECRLEAPWAAGVGAECGTVRVPENPAAPAGRTLELFVARIPSINPAPREDPLLVIAGGPGQAASEFYPALRGAFEPTRRDRDVVLVDQRGTGRSAALACPGVTAASLDLAAVEALPALMADCLADLDGDPRYFTTSVAVADLEQVRGALGIAQWNLYGISYGTRVAQHYLRRYPEYTRAVVLDGVVPSDTALGPDIARNAQRVFDALIERCAAEATCAERYGDLRAKLAGLLEALRESAVTVRLAHPRSGAIGRQTLSATHVAAVIRLLSYTPQTAALLPLLIDEASGGNYAPIAAQSQMIAAELERVLNLPMHNAVVCTEDVPFFPADAAAQSAETYLGTAVLDALAAVCSVWPAGALDADLRAPLASAKPVLLLSGAADPITPPEYAERVLAGLRNARHLIGPGSGHGLAALGCVPRLMRSFLDALEPAALDPACLERERTSPLFLDFNGPSP